MKYTPPSVTYVLPDKLGGVFNYVDNLLAHRRHDPFNYHAVLTDNLPTNDTRSDEKLAADYQSRITYSLPPENLYAVMRRLAQAIPPGDGVIITNDLIELAMLSVHDTGKAVINITHADSDYYYGLAVMHERIIHCFVTYTKWMYNRLVELLPHRKDSIFYLPYGVKIPIKMRHSRGGKLRLLYVGRINKQKGVFNLPEIDLRLRALGVETEWTIQGTGPDEAALKQQWVTPTSIKWSGIKSMDAVLRMYVEHDVLVMPSRSEGLPVALLEACAAGVVPVVSDLPSGIPEVVENGVSGYRRPIGDTAGFAEAIKYLDRNRERLECLSRNARQVVIDNFNIEERALDYQDLYARWRDYYRPHPKDAALNYGSRLDKPWLPNKVVRMLRLSLRSSLLKRNRTPINNHV
jgi:glycosyltransferase involved in cell wall biosynthesis